MKTGRFRISAFAASIGIAFAATSYGVAHAQETEPAKVISARVVAKLADVSPPSDYGNVAILESPVFGEDGKLYFVNLTAGPDQPKIARFDMATKQVEGLYQDDHSKFSSLQFSPADGQMYLTDYGNGKIVKFDLQSRDLDVTFSGEIEGEVRPLDDIAFDKDGNMFVSEESGMPWKPTGMILRFDKTGRNPTVLVSGLSGANGISFSPDYSSLWISEYRRSTLTHIVLDEEKTGVVDATIAAYANSGEHGFDSNAVDTAGNVYQAVWGAGKVLIYGPEGSFLATVKLEDQFDLPQKFSTNLAIRPGTKEAYLIVGGENGGYLYEFEALAEGGVQSNGG